MVKKIVFFVGVLVVCAGVFVGVFVYRAKSVKSIFVGEKVFHIETGERVTAIALRLEEERLVSSRWYFLWSAWRGGLEGNIRAGDFVIAGKLTAGEVVTLLLSEEGKPTEVTITFPEGWDAEKIATRLSANRFDGEAFLRLVMKPRHEWKEAFPILETLPEGASLEGFLFPDTYTFLLSASPDDIIEKMLRNFETRFNEELRSEASRQGKSVFDIVIMASILEREIGTANQSDEDIARERGMVSDLFFGDLPMNTHSRAMRPSRMRAANRRFSIRLMISPSIHPTIPTRTKAFRRDPYQIRDWFRFEPRSFRYRTTSISSSIIPRREKPFSPKPLRNT